MTDPENDHLLPSHVACAAAENWLSTEDESKFGAPFPGVVSGLESAGTLDRRQTDQGCAARNGSPHHEMSLRTVDDGEVKLVAKRRDSATLRRRRAPGRPPRRVYHHQGRRYEVRSSTSTRRGRTRPTWADSSPATSRRPSPSRRTGGAATAAREDVPVRFASVTMRKQITGYERRDGSAGEVLGQRSLDLPETTLETKALYHTVPADLEREIRQGAYGAESGSESGDGVQSGDAVTDGGDAGDDGDFPGAIHAAEHAMISMFPSDYLCDRGDIGGLSTPCHAHTDQSTIFIYDGHPGGVGIARAGYDIVEGLMRQTAELISDCDCEDGCPSCVQSPQCGNANDPLAKAEAVLLLESLTGTRA